MQKRLLLLLHYYYFQFQSSEFIGNAQYAQQGMRNGTVSVHLSVPARAHSSKPAAAGLLLWARQAGDISRLLHGWRSAAAAGGCGQCHFVSVRRMLNTDLFP